MFKVRGANFLDHPVYMLLLLNTSSVFTMDGIWSWTILTAQWPVCWAMEDGWTANENISFGPSDNIKRAARLHCRTRWDVETSSVQDYHLSSLPWDGGDDYVCVTRYYVLLNNGDYCVLEPDFTSTMLFYLQDVVIPWNSSIFASFFV